MRLHTSPEIKYLLPAAFLFFSNIEMKAQNFSCSNAAQYDATYSKAIQQLENVTIYQQQSKPTKETTAKTNSSSWNDGEGPAGGLLRPVAPDMNACCKVSKFFKESIENKLDVDALRLMLDK